MLPSFSSYIRCCFPPVHKVILCSLSTFDNPTIDSIDYNEGRERGGLWGLRYWAILSYAVLRGNFYLELQYCGIL